MSIVKQIILGMKFGTTSEIIMIGTHLPLLLLDRLHLSGLIDSFDFKIAMLTPYIKIHQIHWTDCFYCKSSEHEQSN